MQIEDSDGEKLDYFSDRMSVGGFIMVFTLLIANLSIIGDKLFKLVLFIRWIRIQYVFTTHLSLSTSTEKDNCCS